MTKITPTQHHQLISKLRADRIPAVVLGDTTFLINQDTGHLSLLSGGVITNTQRELFNLWLVNQYGDILSDSESKADKVLSPLDNVEQWIANMSQDEFEALQIASSVTSDTEGERELPWVDRVSVADTHPSSLGIPQLMNQNANRNPINEALLRQTPEELHANIKQIMDSGSYTGEHADKLPLIVTLIEETLEELNEKAIEEQYVAAIEYTIDGESRYITLDGKSEKEAIALLSEAIRLGRAKATTTMFTPVKLKKDDIPNLPEVRPMVEWSHVSEPGIVVARLDNSESDESGTVVAGNQREYKPGDEGYIELNKIAVNATIQSIQNEAEVWYAKQKDTVTPDYPDLTDVTIVTTRNPNPGEDD